MKRSMNVKVNRRGKLEPMPLCDRERPPKPAKLPPPPPKAAMDVIGSVFQHPPRVQIDWRDPEHDWPWFFLLELRGEWMKLRGADYPDGSAKHDGDVIWVHRADISGITEERRLDAGDPSH